MSTLISSGCSFVWGNEMPDCTENRPSRYTWPSLLASDLKMGYVCVAKPGCGNSAITRRIIKAVNNTPNIGAVAVMWSWTNRFELQIRGDIARDYITLHKDINLPGNMDEHNWFNMCHFNVKPVEEKIKIFDADEYHKQKIIKAQKFLEDSRLNDYANDLFYLIDGNYPASLTMQSVHHLQLFLQSRGIPYVFACTSDEFAMMKQEDPMADLIDWDKFVCLDVGFFQWIDNHNLFKHKGGHPTSDAHKTWYTEHYKYIKQVLKK
jgi:hypothetical protein